MDTNFLGPVRVNRALLPHMRRQRSGLLMHISSGAGRVVLPSAGFYCADGGLAIALYSILPPSVQSRIGNVTLVSPGIGINDASLSG
jgi:NADP-dependent 3-hydroxy acid dehydrogenase YdfG